MKNYRYVVKSRYKNGFVEIVLCAQWGDAIKEVNKLINNRFSELVQVIVAEKVDYLDISFVNKTIKINIEFRGTINE